MELYHDLSTLMDNPANIYYSKYLKQIMSQCLCISHTDDQFETPNDLMEWLNSSLRNTHRGYYRFRKGPKLKALKPGSIVLFHKNGLILGSAVVEKASRPLTQSEIDECDEIYGTSNGCSKMKNIIKFFPNSIWVWDEHELVSADEFEEITGDELRHYIYIKPAHVLEIYRLVAEKRQKMESWV